MRDQDISSNEEKKNPATGGYQLGGGEEQGQEAQSGDENTEIDTSELGNSKEIDLDRSGPNTQSGDDDSRQFGGDAVGGGSEGPELYSGSAGSDTNKNAGGDVSGKNIDLRDDSLRQ